MYLFVFFFQSLREMQVISGMHFHKLHNVRVCIISTSMQWHPLPSQELEIGQDPQKEFPVLFLLLGVL